MQTIEGKVDTSTILDASLVDTESSGIELKEQVTSNISGNDAHADDADIRPIYDEESMVEERESAFTKPYHMTASSESRNSSKNMPRFSSNDMVHNHYLEEAKKKAQEKGRNSRPSVMPSARSQCTANVGIRWVPTGKIFTSSTTKVDSEPTNGSNEHITNQYECEQTLDVSIGTLNLSTAMTSDHNSDHNNKQSSSKLVPNGVPPADKTTTSQQELELLFSPMYEEYFNAGNPSVSKSSALSDNLQQHDTQPTTNIHPTLESIIPPLNNYAEDNK
ncbi:hypothetical protein Tco_0905600 [Tanacetum coccineum]